MLVGLVIGWLRAMAITEEEKQLREAVRASLLTAASERRSTVSRRTLNAVQVDGCARADGTPAVGQLHSSMSQAAA